MPARLTKIEKGVLILAAAILDKLDQQQEHSGLRGMLVFWKEHQGSAFLSHKEAAAELRRLAL